jgi:N-acetyl-alpha-D-glucosaminyl L-malate synthase BshA
VNERTLAVVCYPSLGGSGIVATDLALGLSARGHTVHMITTSPLARALPRSERLQLHVAEAPDYPLFDAPPQMLGLAGAIARICDGYGVELLHVHYAVPHAASAYLARQLLGARGPALVTTLHGSDVTRVGIDPAYQEITRFCVETSDAITAPSVYLRERAYELLGISLARRIEVIENAVDTERFVPAHTRDPHYFDALFGTAGGEPIKTLLHVSNFRAVKRTGDLIELASELNKQLPVRLVLVGEGPERAACEARTRELGLGHRIKFLGALTDFTAHLQQADAFVLASENESFGLAALEALSCGVPVFAYKVGGLGSVVTEDAGRLVPAFDRAALRRALTEVLRDDALQRKLGQAARQRAHDRYRMQPTLDRYEHLYERLCSSRPVPRE